MQKNKRPLLSICIPTYNRAHILDEVLNNFCCNPEVDDEVEIIISDNASTDTTYDVCMKYIHLNKSFKYYRNAKNIRDENFVVVLDYGSGYYLKLLNDWVYYSEDDLKYIKNKIKHHIHSGEAIFFTSDCIYTKKKQEKIICNNLDEYVQAISTFVTYNNIFGVWRDDWKNVKEKRKFSNLQLQQVDWSYQIVDSKNGCILYDKSLLRSTNIPLGPRGGYNWFKIHLDNYYLIMNQYINSGKITKYTYREDSHYLLEHFKPELCNTYFVKLNNNWQFYTKGTAQLLFKYYKYDMYFYCYLLKLPIWYVKTIIFSLLRKLKYIIK